MARRARLILTAVSLAALVGGCGHSAANQATLLQPGMLPPLHVTQPVAVIAGRPDSAGRRAPIVGSDVSIDYTQFTRTAVDRLHQELTRLGVPTAPDASRRLEISLMYVDLLIQSAGTQTACIIDFRVTLGDGTVRGLQARAKSSDYEEACDAAQTDVTVVTLNDPVVQRYLIAPAT
jgi:hypothetical protein